MYLLSSCSLAFSTTSCARAESLTGARLFVRVNCFVCLFVFLHRVPEWVSRFNFTFLPIMYSRGRMICIDFLARKNKAMCLFTSPVRKSEFVQSRFV